MLKLVHDATATAVDDPEALTMSLDELCRMAAQDMLAVSLLAERRAYLEAHADLLDATGKRLVVGNGFARAREVTTGAGMVEVAAPRVDDRREGERFSSAILPAYMRKSPKVTEVLPILYLRGLSTGDFAPALGGFFGSDAGLSASTVNRLTEAWQAEHAEWSERDLSGLDYVYWWVDGIHFNIRLEEDRLCTSSSSGSALTAPKSWSPWPTATANRPRAGPRSCARCATWVDRPRARGRRRGARVLGGAARCLPRRPREQRCWVHATKNVLDALPKRAPRRRQGSPQGDLRSAESRTDALEAVKRFADEFARLPQGHEEDHRPARRAPRLLRLPLEHWIHLRTTNPIESTFSTVRLRTKVTRGAGSRKAGLAMAYKLLDAAQARWRRINGHELVPLVRAAPPSSTASYKRGANRRQTPTSSTGPSLPDAISIHNS